MFFVVVFFVASQASLVELGRADNGDGLRQHHLVRAVRVQVHAGQERRLSWVSL